MFPKTLSFSKIPFAPTRLLVSILLLTLCVGVTSAAPESFPALKVDGTSLHIVSDGEVTFRLLGPEGVIFHKLLDTGVTVELPYDAPDGLYRWELRPTGEIPPELENLDRSQGAVESFLPAAPTASGAFTVEGGRIVDPELPEYDAESGQKAALTKDTYHHEAHVNYEGVCVGNGCLNNMDYTNKQLILRANAVRMDFVDSSNLAGFPSQDWRIEINDANSGGSGHFTVMETTSAAVRPFSIESGAWNHSLFVGKYGHLGLGTSTPEYNMHVVEGDTPTLRLEQSGSSGFAPQVWDVAGNETNFFVRNATDGSILPLRILREAPGNALVAAETGVGIGTHRPEAKLHVIGDVKADSADLSGNLSAGGTVSSAAVSTGSLEATTTTTLALTVDQWEIGAGPGGSLQISSVSGSTSTPVLTIDADGDWQSAVPDTELANSRPALASSVQGSFGAANAVDGDFDSPWKSTGAGDHWLRIDLGSERELTGLLVEWAPGEHATVYAVQVSRDGLDWSSPYSNVAGDGGTDECTFSAQGRYVRLFVPSALNGSGGVGVDEIEVYGRP